MIVTLVSKNVSIMRWIFRRSVTWALITPASLTASGPQILQVRWVSSFSIETYGDFGDPADPPSLSLWLLNIAMV